MNYMNTFAKLRDPPPTESAGCALSWFMFPRNMRQDPWGGGLSFNTSECNTILWLLSEPFRKKCVYPLSWRISLIVISSWSGKTCTCLDGFTLVSEDTWVCCFTIFFGVGEGTPLYDIYNRSLLQAEEWLFFTFRLKWRWKNCSDTPRACSNKPASRISARSYCGIIIVSFQNDNIIPFCSSLHRDFWHRRRTSPRPHTFRVKVTLQMWIELA